MNHETDTEEERGLREHLAACAECTRFERELQSGLGRARPHHLRAAGSDLPPGWDASLADATAGLRRRSWAREALLVGSGLAAGVLGMLAWKALSSPHASSQAIASTDADAPAFLRFHGGETPPPATAGGPVPRFLAWQAR
jgi:hypothetical protein